MLVNTEGREGSEAGKKEEEWVAEARQGGKMLHGIGEKMWKKVLQRGCEHRALGRQERGGKVSKCKRKVETRKGFRRRM